MTNEEKKNALKTIINGIIDAFFETQNSQENEPPQSDPPCNPMSQQPEPQMSIKESQRPTVRELVGKCPNPPSSIGSIVLHCGDITPEDEDENKRSIMNLKRIFEWGLENSLVESYTNVSRGIIMLDRTITETTVCLYDQIEVFVKVDNGSATIVTGLKAHNGELRTQALDAPIIIYPRLSKDGMNDLREPMNMACIIPINNFDLKLINQYYKVGNTVTDVVEKKYMEYTEFYASISSAIQDYRFNMGDASDKGWNMFKL